MHHIFNYVFQLIPFSRGSIMWNKLNIFTVLVSLWSNKYFFILIMWSFVFFLRVFVSSTWSCHFCLIDLLWGTSIFIRDPCKLSKFVRCFCIFTYWFSKHLVWKKNGNIIYIKSRCDGLNIDREAFFLTMFFYIYFKPFLFKVKGVWRKKVVPISQISKYTKSV